MEEKIVAGNSEELITHYSAISTYETICYVKYCTVYLFVR
jgi:hypothetical protein